MADLSGQFAPENYNRVLAALLMKQGLDTSPIQSWTQGAARLAQALVGARYRDLDRADMLAAMQYNPMSQSPMGNRVAEALAPSQGVTPPSMAVQGGGSVPVPPPRPIFNRSSLTDEANQPEMAQRLATIVQGEVGRNATPEQKAIQLESILNRASARNQTLGDVTQQYTGPGSAGYYPVSTFANGQASPIETAQFAQNTLTPALRGSDVSGATLGFPATGNASGAVAANGINSGRYSQYASFGPPGAQETYVQQPSGKEDIARLEATRLAQNTQSPIDAMAANVERTLADPNVSDAVKRQAYGFKQWIIQHRLEQNMKYGPEALAGEGALAGAKKGGELGAEYSPSNIAGAALKAGMEKAATLPSEKELKGTPTFTEKVNQEQKTNAQRVLSTTVGNVADAYLALDKLGGVVNPDRTATENLQARARSSAAGQATGMAVGTQESSIRQQIANSQPQLINAIRQATNMGARGLDSNVELAFYMKQVGDPTRDIYSNLAALDRLDKAYGLGLGVKSKVSPAMYNKIQSAQNQLGDQFNAISKAGQGGDMLSQAKDAISRGAPRDAVIQRLQQNGIDPGGL